MTRLTVTRAAGCAAALALGVWGLGGGASSTVAASGSNGEFEVVQAAAAQQAAQPRAAQARPDAAPTQPRAQQGNAAHGQANGAAADADLPPNAQPGDCYARVFTPAEYRTTTETVVVRAESEKIDVVPAVFKPVEKQVVVKEESERIEVIPAKYDWVEEKILIKPETERLVTVPAVYEDVTEQVLVRPAYTAWKKGRGPIERVDNATGEIMCLVEVPAEYKSVKKRVVKSAAETRTEKVPAVYKIVKKQVMVEAPKTKTVTVPAEYKTEVVSELVEAAKEKRTKIPAQHAEVAKQTKVADGKLEWRSILCETNATPEMVKRIQSALKRSGHDPGEIDGRIGQGTMTALKSYQDSKGLPAGQITLETLKSLGVQL